MTPLVRAGLCQQSLATIRALAPAALDVVPAAIIARVESAARTEWLPLDHDTLLLEAHWQLVGAAHHRKAWREAMEQNFRGAMLGPVLKVAVGMFGHSPSGLLQFFPQAYGALFRDAGRIEIVENADSRGVALHRDAPEGDALADSIAATLDAGIAFSGRVGVTTVTRAPEGVLYTLAWRL